MGMHTMMGAFCTVYKLRCTFCLGLGLSQGLGLGFGLGLGLGLGFRIAVSCAVYRMRNTIIKEYQLTECA